MKKNFFVLSLLCLLVISCKKDPSFIEGNYGATYNGLYDVRLHIYEYEDGQYAWLMHEETNGDNMIAGKVSILFDGIDTLAAFSKDVVVGDDYRKFKGLFDTLRINYNKTQKMGILKFSPSNYIFFKRLDRKDEKTENIMKESMRVFTKKIKR